MDAAGPFRISPKVIVGVTIALSIFSTLQACQRRYPHYRRRAVRLPPRAADRHAARADPVMDGARVVWEMMVYWGVLGISMALDFQRTAQAQVLNSAQLETRLAEASLQSLQRQLHPHFLFNTLHTISALMHKDPETADAMLAQLADLLRLTLDRVGTQEVPLKEELDFLEKYISIERTRFGDRLQVSMQIDPETLDAAVPNLPLPADAAPRPRSAGPPPRR